MTLNSDETLKDFQLENNHDYITLLENSSSGNYISKDPEVKFTGTGAPYNVPILQNEMFHFHTDISVNGKGFKVCANEGFLTTSTTTTSNVCSDQQMDGGCYSNTENTECKGNVNNSSTGEASPCPVCPTGCELYSGSCYDENSRVGSIGSAYYTRQCDDIGPCPDVDCYPEYMSSGNIECVRNIPGRGYSLARTESCRRTTQATRPHRIPHTSQATLPHTTQPTSQQTTQSESGSSESGSSESGSSEMADLIGVLLGLI